mmetsp:Transcript_7416/g.18242  ORF Transcript_7416/g.18242 Transcript_7416/m.18242 type:complete len:275 (-) Transcript_7416:3759-4583(-)
MTKLGAILVDQLLHHVVHRIRLLCEHRSVSIVLDGVILHQFEIFQHTFCGSILEAINLFLDRTKIHGVRDHFVVRRVMPAIDGLLERCSAWPIVGDAPYLFQPLGVDDMWPSLSDRSTLFAIAGRLTFLDGRKYFSFIIIGPFAFLCLRRLQPSDLHLLLLRYTRTCPAHPSAIFLSSLISLTRIFGTPYERVLFFEHGMPKLLIFRNILWLHFRLGAKVGMCINLVHDFANNFGVHDKLELRNLSTVRICRCNALPDNFSVWIWCRHGSWLSC